MVHWRIYSFSRRILRRICNKWIDNWIRKRRFFWNAISKDVHKHSQGNPSKLIHLNVVYFVSFRSIYKILKIFFWEKFWYRNEPHFRSKQRQVSVDIKLFLISKYNERIPNGIPFCYKTRGRPTFHPIHFRPKSFRRKIFVQS